MSPTSHRRCRGRGIAIACLVTLVSFDAGTRHASARSLQDLFDEVLVFGGRLDRSPQFREPLERVILEFERNAVRASDFVATAASPGFAYSYDPETGALLRAETSRGAVYVEPADTIGRRTLEFGVSYLYLDYDDLDGEPLDDVLDLNEVRGTDFLRVRTRSLTFRSQVFAASATYGITDRWDVNVFIPILLTTLGLEGNAALSIPDVEPFTPVFDDEDAKLGVGDVLLRTKYRMPSRLTLDLAAAFTLKVPSGDPENFQGLGDVVLTPLLVVQRTIGPHRLHANAGIEINASDVRLSRARYAVGAAFRLPGPLTIFADVIGTSGFEDDHFDEDGIHSVLARSDVVDAATGFEIALWANVVAHIGVIVPVTDDGLRAEVVPAGGVDARF